MNENWTPTDYPSTPPAAAANQQQRGSRLVVPVLIASLLSAGLAAGGTALVVNQEGGGSTTIVRQVANPANSSSALGSSAMPVASSGGMSIEAMYQQYGNGVVRVEHSNGLGSGFVIDSEGHILTNAHVVDGAQGDVTVSFSNNEKVVAKVIGVDNATDVALLKVDVPSSALTVIPLGDSSTVKVGNQVVAIGNPFGQDRTVTSGIVSAVARSIQAPNGFSINDAIQTDASINHGNSGGPLLDGMGQVIGINSQINTGGQANSGSVGIAFAVPINLVKQVTADIMATGKAQHAWLGVRLSDVDPTLASQIKIGSDYGAMVAAVTTGSPAAKAGLEGATGQTTIGGRSYAVGGDVIIEANGAKIEDVKGLQAAVSALKPGDKLELVVKTRSGETKNITVTLGDQPQDPTALAG
ncbi:MAG: trypsin-like serine protease [Thermoleophilia bacterium]|nr:trypsin-like serine protease [Thermoleophilia bacterium]